MISTKESWKILFEYIDLIRFIVCHRGEQGVTVERIVWAFQDAPCNPFDLIKAAKMFGKITEHDGVLYWRELNG